MSPWRHSAWTAHKAISFGAGRFLMCRSLPPSIRTTVGLRLRPRPDAHNHRRRHLVLPAQGLALADASSPSSPREVRTPQVARREPEIWAASFRALRCSGDTERANCSECLGCPARKRHLRVGAFGVRSGVAANRLCTNCRPSSTNRSRGSSSCTMKFGSPQSLRAPLRISSARRLFS